MDGRMMRLFQRQLTNLESGLKRLEDEKVRMELEVWALRQHISTVSLSTVLDLVHAAMLRAQWWARDMPASAQLRDLASRVLLTHPSVERNLAAVYQELRVMHLDCSHCVQAEKVCPVGAAMCILRDIFLIAVTIGKGTMNHLLLKGLLDVAMIDSCNREMDKIERSQLTLSFMKVLALGRTRLGFDEAMRDPKLYGDNLTDQQVDALFLTYNTCWQASPAYQSKNKASKKRKQKPKTGGRGETEGETEGRVETDGHCEADWETDGSGEAQPPKLLMSASAIPWTPWQGFASADHASALTCPEVALATTWQGVAPAHPVSEPPFFLPSFDAWEDNGASAAASWHALASAAGSGSSHDNGAAMPSAPPGLSEPLPM